MTTTTTRNTYIRSRRYNSYPIIKNIIVVALILLIVSELEQRGSSTCTNFHVVVGFAPTQSYHRSTLSSGSSYNRYDDYCSCANSLNGMKLYSDMTKGRVSSNSARSDGAAVGGKRIRGEGQAQTQTQKRAQGQRQTQTQNRGKRKVKKDEVSDLKAIDGFSEMLNHRLLSKEEEKELSQSVKYGHRLRDNIKEIVNEKRYFEDCENQVEIIQTRGKKRSKILDASQLYGRSAAKENAMLSEEDIVNKLQLAGGNEELEMILKEASKARQQLILCNLKLVVSISRKVRRYFIFIAFISSVRVLNMRIYPGLHQAT